MKTSELYSQDSLGYDVYKSLEEKDCQLCKMELATYLCGSIPSCEQCYEEQNQ